MKRTISIITVLLALFGAFSPVFAFGTLSLSQTFLNLNVGQSATLTAYPPSGQIVNVTGVTNSFAAYANVSGNQITVYGLGAGSSQITLCTYDNTCGTVNVTVGGGSGNQGQISLSQTNLNLNLNQSMTVTATNPFGGSIYISNNSNSSVASAYVSGNNLVVTANNSGSTTLTVCGNNASCSYLYVNVSGTSGQISFSQNNISLNANQSTQVTVFNATNPYISTNSNPNVASAYVSGNTIYITGYNQGSTMLTVCANNTQCNYLYVNVGGSQSQISLSHSNLTMSVGSYNTVIVNTTGGTAYISNNTYPNIANVTLSGNLIAINALNTGSTMVTICVSNNVCTTLYINVSGSNLHFTTTSLPQMVANQYYSYQLSVSGGNPPYNYSVNFGSLPSGLYLTNSGLIYGTPAANTSSTFSIRATDALNRTVYSPSFTLSTGSVAGSTIYNNGTLINDNGTIYITYKNTKSPFANYHSLVGLGYNPRNAINASSAALNFSGFTISSPEIAHPWGSWIKSGSTIYFVHEAGLIPIADYSVFINNGDNAVNIVPANAYDFYKGTQSIMVNNDSRLK